MRGFADHFSAQAAVYARGRPRYPDALYERLAELAPNRERCWDCATGNGQAALGLARHFEEVIATDASAEQLAHAPSHPRVRYHRALAEESGIEATSVDLVCVAAAVHWFDLKRFYAEVRRVARPGAALALWTYGAGIEPLPDDGGALVRALGHVADEVLAGDWPPEFHHVRTRYTELPFPFEELAMPELAAEIECDLEALLGFVHSWSAWERHRRARGEGALARADEELTKAWRAGGAEHERRPMRLPLSFRVGQVS